MIGAGKKMIRSVIKINSTGQYMYIQLTHEKLSHMKRPSRKKKKLGNCFTLGM
jgi:hypothetical protein